jgi:hypothetical protein
MRLFAFLVVLCAPQLAAAHTIQGEVRVTDDAVDVVARTNTYRLVGRTQADKARISDVGRFLAGELVTLEGKLFMSERGPYLVPSEVTAPVRTQIVASGSTSRYRRELQWRGETVPASGIDQAVPTRDTRLDVYLFKDGSRVERVHVVGIEAEVGGTYTKTLQKVHRPGWIRGVERKRHVGWIPLPPGNPTTLWDFTTTSYQVDEPARGEVPARSKWITGFFVSIPSADPTDAEWLLDATEVPEGQGIEDALRRQR